MYRDRTKREWEEYEGGWTEVCAFFSFTLYNMQKRISMDFIASKESFEFIPLVSQCDEDEQEKVKWASEREHRKRKKIEKNTRSHTFYPNY